MEYPVVDTWFFESLNLTFSDSLSIKLVEGIKDDEREYVEVADKRLGPYFPVRILAQSRVLRILFNEVISFHVISESFSSTQTSPVVLRKIGPVAVCEQLAYRQFVESDSLVVQLVERPFHSYFIWTEDQSLYVLAESDPVLTISDEVPDLKIQRGATYFAK